MLMIKRSLLDDAMLWFSNCCRRTLQLVLALNHNIHGRNDADKNVVCWCIFTAGLWSAVAMQVCSGLLKLLCGVGFGLP